MKSNLILILSFLFLLSCAKKESNTLSTSQKPLVKTISFDSTLLGSYWYDGKGRLTCSRTLKSPVIDSTVYFYGNNSLDSKKFHDGTLIEVEHSIIESGQVVSTNGIKSDSSSF